MQELGEYLRELREAKNISLKDIQESTKIRLHYLEAIEAGSFGVIPGEVYLKGFLTNYANAIGIDSREVLKRYYDLKTTHELQQNLSTVQMPLISNEPDKLNFGKVFKAEWFKGVYLGMAAALMAMLLVSFFVLPSFQGGHSKETSGLNSTPTQEQLNNNSENLLAPITVDAEFSQRVWVMVKADGRNLFGESGVTFGPTDSRQEWTAQREMVIELGNAGGVRLIYNGNDLGKIGKMGETKRLRLTPEGLAAP